MEPDFPKNTVVLIQQTDIETLEVGDTVVFKSNALGGGLAFHRITKITEEGFYTKGDNNKHGDNQLITQETFVGVCVFSTDLLARFLRVVEKPSALLFYVFLPAFLIYTATFLIKNLREEGQIF